MNSMARACSMVVNLLFPRGCAGCDKPDEVLCEACRALFSQPTAQSFDGVAMQRWFACGWYRGTVRRAVLAWKDHGDEECDRAFADAICALAKASGVIDFVVIGMVHAMMLLWFPRLRLPLQYVVADVNI